MQMTQFLVEPGCTPSHAALMTGRYSTRAGLNTVIISGTPNTLQASEVTLAELFKSQGYAMAHAGKWHIGYDDEQTALEMRATLAKLQKEYLIEMKDVIVVTISWRTR
jgi:arylsulfatase A-like enzyme